jgi:hypothetical protein
MLSKIAALAARFFLLFRCFPGQHFRGTKRDRLIWSSRAVEME